MASRQATWDETLEASVLRAAAESGSDFLTPRGLARALGIGESSVKRWTNEGLIGVVKTVGGHRRIPVSEALRFAREAGLAAVPRRAESAPGAGVAGESLGEDALLAALVEGDAERAKRLVLAEHYGGRSVAEICDGPMRGALARIGEMWRDDEALGILVEHRATEICFEAVRRLQALPDRPAGRRGLAIGCAPGRDVYALPTLVAAVVLREAGFVAMNLGAATPMHVLARAVDEHRPRIAWLAMNADGGEGAHDGVADAARALADRMAKWNGFLVAGGRNVPRELREARAPGLRCFATMAEFAGFAKQVGTESGE